MVAELPAFLNIKVALSRSKVTSKKALETGYAGPSARVCKLHSPPRAG